MCEPKKNSYLDFQAPSDCEFLWTTGEEIEFSLGHCEVPKQPNLDFYF
jgi:hypothetical protein